MNGQSVGQVHTQDVRMIRLPDRQNDGPRIVKVIRSNKEHCKSVYNVTNLKVSDIEATLLVLIAAELVGWSIKKKEKGKEFVTLNLPREKCKFRIQDDDAWKVIPDRYFC